ncbi:hypothetical protein J2Y58_000559 [Sphingomonas sp. BE138]|uniref:hypothetical protein n=1 Tax=Sphingomonas sp. BE138 TaxID=2817845 RepID=UPI00286716F5|nr:hypothetical protein [Sphingomonas sp. BE138]MDR6787218.1 hypothetical protein [Sphingomonas sp. BE138]
MVSFSRRSQILLASSAALFLASCGADDVASPGAGSVPVTINQPAPTPTPTGTATPTPLTAAQFAAPTTQSGVTITSDEQLALVNAGTNNNVNGFGATLSGVYPTSGTSLATASNPQTVLGNTAFLQNTSYVGALSGPNDNAFSGWTCNSSSASFLNSTACTAVPAIGSGTPAASCPAGLTDDGLNNSNTASNPATFRYCRLPQVITADLTLAKIPGLVYRFRGQTEVGVDGTSNVTLTIAPGVVLAADSSETSNDLLLVNRGSKINAVGTADAPIVFTAQQNLTANGVSDSSQGLWGGVILLGRAPTAVCATGTGPNTADGLSTGAAAPCQQAIEGVTGRLYGGTNAADSSGTMQYVQIRYTGIAISEGNELQGLTLGGTGSGTTIDHVQSHNSADDGIEIFGGTTNLKYFVVTGADDDGFDVDNGWRGFMQFIIAAQKANGATNDSFATEIDSNGQEDLLPRTYGRYANFTFIQTASTQNPVAAIRLRGGADFAFVNGIVKTPSGEACLNVVAGAGTGADRTTIRPANSALQDVGPPTFNSVYFQCQGR